VAGRRTGCRRPAAAPACPRALVWPRRRVICSDDLCRSALEQIGGYALKTDAIECGGRGLKPGSCAVASGSVTGVYRDQTPTGQQGQPPVKSLQARHRGVRPSCRTTRPARWVRSELRQGSRHSHHLGACGVPGGRVSAGLGVRPMGDATASWCWRPAENPPGLTVYLSHHPAVVLHQHGRLHRVQRHHRAQHVERQPNVSDWRQRLSAASASRWVQRLDQPTGPPVEPRMRGGDRCQSVIHELLHSGGGHRSRGAVGKFA
jgi:hypothetical protein